MQRFSLNTLFIACFISLGLVSCGGGSGGVFTSSSSVTKSTFALDENNNLYLSTNGSSYSQVQTTGFPGKTNYTTQAGSNLAATVGEDGYIAVSLNLKDWSPASSPSTVMVNGLRLSRALYNVIATATNNFAISSVGASSDVQPTTLVAVGALGNIQVVTSASPSISLIQAVKEHKLKYRQITDSPTNNDLYGTAQDQNTNYIVAVGAAGTIIVSKNMGNTWQNIDVSATSKSQIKAVRNNFYAVAALNHKLFAVGDSGMVETSSNGGETWKPENTEVSVPLLTVKEANNTIIAGGISSTIIYSEDDGGTWHKGTLPKDLQNGAVAIRDISVNADGTETAYCVPTPSSGKLSARDIFLRKHSLNDPLSQVILTSNDAGKTWTEEIVSSTAASSSNVGATTTSLSTIQNMFNNPQTIPTSNFSNTIKTLSTGSTGFHIGK